MFTPDFFRKDTRSCGCAETSARLQPLKLARAVRTSKLNKMLGNGF